MAFVRVEFKADTDVIDAIVEDFQRAPIHFNTGVNVILPRYVARAERELTPYPGKPHYPLRWKSARQRRAYFASRGFGRGIPYQRTRGLQRAWKVGYRPLRADGSGGEIVIRNEDPKAPFVIGAEQQPFHADTGWIRVDQSPQVDQMQLDLTNDLIDLWGSVVLS